MNTYNLNRSPRFDKSLRKLDPSTQRRVLAALLALAVLDNPAEKLKPLRHSKVGLKRLRVGDYRVIVSVHGSTLTIVALDVGHRSTVYDDD